MKDIVRDSEGRTLFFSVKLNLDKMGMKENKSESRIIVGRESVTFIQKGVIT